jgi:acyl-coenzyme A thioesterase PaaI-like protein
MPEHTSMPESIKSKFLRWGFNLFPAYCFTGARITYISHDFRQVVVRLPLSWQTRNVVGTIFGGSMYAAVDPVYMLMLIKNLGPDYVVWDRSACIDFKKPGRTALFARFQIDGAELDAIRRELEQVRHVDRVYHVDLVDEQGTVHASVEKVVYIRRKEQARSNRDKILRETSNLKGEL